MRYPFLNGTNPPPVKGSLSINDDGVLLGATTLLVKMASEGRTLSCDHDRERLFTLLTVAFGRPVAPCILSHLRDAAKYWEKGDKALANLRLAFVDLPRLEDPVDAWSSTIAERATEQ